MFVRFFAFLMLFCSMIFAAKIENVEFLADNITKEGDKFYANGSVLVYSKDYLINANRAIYNQKTKIIELFGNVNVIRSGSEILRTTFMKLNTQNNDMDFDSSFAMNRNQEIWISSLQSGSDSDYYFTKNSSVSSCNVKDPDWHMTYTSGYVNKKSKFLHVFNTVFYLGKVPVLYLPYFGFPTDNTRRSGLLQPNFGYKKKEGFLYIQPIYFAPYDSWDFELDPQLRNRRGAGIYSTFRFVDSPYSSGFIRGGFFRDKEHFTRDENLLNRDHKGFELEYDRSRLAKYLYDGGYDENLWAEFINQNDVEYRTLQQFNGGDENKLVRSRLNYYATGEQNYLGFYLKYYKDLSKVGSRYENKTTVQELPTLQYHNFFNTFINKHFTYSFDTKFHNFTRDIGVKARQIEVNAPIGFNFDLPGEWANLSFSENFYGTKIDYDRNLNTSHNDYFRIYHKIALDSELIADLGKFYHTLGLNLTYIKPGYKYGEIDEIIPSNELKNEANFIKGLGKNYTDENVQTKLVQFFYDKAGSKFLQHSIAQNINLKTHTKNDLENRTKVFFNGGSVYNNFSYSDEIHDFSKVQTGTNLNYEMFDFGLSHNYSKESRDSHHSSYVISNLAINFPQQYKISGGIEYDRALKRTKAWNLVLSHHRRCWNYSFVYRQDIEPITTKKGNDSKRTHGIYLMFAFYPMGAIDYDYKKEIDPREKEK